MASHFFKAKQAASTTEMGLLIGLIAIAIIASINSVGDEINAVFGKVSVDLNSTSVGSDVSDPADSKTYVNCKALQGTAADKGTGTYTLAGGQTVTCNMDLQGGGWTQLNSYSQSGNGSRWLHTVNDLNIEYDQLLISGKPGNTLDYETVNHFSDSRGIHTGRLVLTVNGVNYVRQGAVIGITNTTDPLYPGCFAASRYQELPAANYNLISPVPSGDCLIGGTTPSGYCAESVLVDLPTNGRISGIADLKSFEGVCTANNAINLNYDLFVR